MVAQKLSRDYAIDYVKTVKDKFQDKSQIYDDFLEVINDFRAQRVDTSGVIVRLKELFKGQHELLLRFNTFLPKGFEIQLESDQNQSSFGKALGFLTRVKTRFKDDEHQYRSFIDILNKYRKEKKPIVEVYQEVTILLGDHQDLLVEFTSYLPQTFSTSSIMPQNGI